MKLKLDADGKAVLQDGHPVYIHDDGKEVPFDAPRAAAKIKELNTESQNHRVRADTAEAGLKVWEGLDPAAAKAAIEKVANLDSKQLIAAGEKDRAVADAVAATEAKFKPFVSKAEKLELELTDLRIGGGFNGSKFATEKLVAQGQAGAEMARALFGNKFKVVDGAVRGHDMAGNPIFSRQRPGEYAGFDEALEILVDGYAHKDQILRASGQSGGGAQGGGNNGGGGKKSLSRSAFDSLSPMEQAGHVRGGGTVSD